MFYRLPSKFNVDLPIINIYILSFAPLFAMATDLWMFGNKQMFGSHVDSKEQ